MDDDSLIELLRRLLEGDLRATREFIERVSPEIHAVVSATLCRYTAPAARSRARHDVEDLVQEIVFALLANDGKRLRAYDANEGLPLVSWIRLIAKRLVISFLRKRDHRVWENDAIEDDDVVGVEDSAVSPERLSELKEVYEAVLAKVEAELTAQGRKVLQMLLIEGRSVADVAAELRITANAVHVWRTRLMQRIDEAVRRILRGRFDDT